MSERELGQPACHCGRVGSAEYSPQALAGLTIMIFNLDVTVCLYAIRHLRVVIDDCLSQTFLCEAVRVGQVRAVKLGSLYVRVDQRDMLQSCARKVRASQDGTLKACFPKSCPHQVRIGQVRFKEHSPLHFSKLEIRAIRAHAG